MHRLASRLFCRFSLPIGILSLATPSASPTARWKQPLPSIATRCHSYNNTASLTVSRRFGKVGLALGTSRMDIWARHYPGQQYDEYSFSVTPSYYVTDTSSVFRSRESMALPERHLALQPRFDLLQYQRRHPGHDHQEHLGRCQNIGLVPYHARGGRQQRGPQHPQKPTTTQNFDGVNGTTALRYTNPLRPNTTHSVSFSYSPG